MRKYLILILILFFLALIQESFFYHFKILGVQPNLVLILIFILSFFEPAQKNFGIFAGFSGGAILDFYSSFPIWTLFLTLGILSFLVKKLSSFLQKSNILGVLAIFLFYFISYKIVCSFFGGGINFLFQKEFLVEFLYNFLLVGFSFIFLKKL